MFFPFALQSFLLSPLLILFCFGSSLDCNMRWEKWRSIQIRHRFKILVEVRQRFVVRGRNAIYGINEAFTEEDLSIFLVFLMLLDLES